MSFFIDTQTLNDLQIKGHRDEPQVFSQFDRTLTTGGHNKLEQIFSAPLTDVETLRQRTELIRYLNTHPLPFHPDREMFSIIELYLGKPYPGKRFSVSRSVWSSVKYYFRPGNEQYLVKRGVSFLIQVFNDFITAIEGIPASSAPAVLLEYIENMRHCLIEHAIRNSKQKLSLLQLQKPDFLFRKKYASETRNILEMIYVLDAFTAVAQSMQEQSFSLPVFLEEPCGFEVTGLFHPMIKEAVPNDITFSSARHLLLLTGPNMAGKSTFMKALGISVYLAHLGFPVPAASLKISIFNGMLSSINLPDKISKGYSHFLHEVVRIREVAEKLRNPGNLFVIFDEIFRGTNVKDAHDASLEVISTLAATGRGVFAISTHIVEIAEPLKKHPTIFFRYFEAGMKNGEPDFSYRLCEGINEERLGVYILHREKVIELLRQSLPGASIPMLTNIEKR